MIARISIGQRSKLVPITSTIGDIFIIKAANRYYGYRNLRLTEGFDSPDAVKFGSRYYAIDDFRILGHHIQP